MADILIKNINKPKNCVLEEHLSDGSIVKHEIIELPPHGRLIDADRLAVAVAKAQDSMLHKDYSPFMLLGDVLRWIALAPTIVEASYGSDN